MIYFVVPISKARTINGYPARHKGELSFKINQDVTIYSKPAENSTSSSDLWGAEINGKRGYVPSTFIRESSILHIPKYLVDVESVTEAKVPSTNESADNKISADSVQQPYEVIDGTTIFGNDKDVEPSSTQDPVQATATLEHTKDNVETKPLTFKSNEIKENRKQETSEVVNSTDTTIENKVYNNNKEKIYEGVNISDKLSDHQKLEESTIDNIEGVAPKEDNYVGEGDTAVEQKINDEVENKAEITNEDVIENDTLHNAQGNNVAEDLAAEKTEDPKVVVDKVEQNIEPQQLNIDLHNVTKTDEETKQESGQVQPDLDIESVASQTTDPAKVIENVVYSTDIPTTEVPFIEKDPLQDVTNEDSIFTESPLATNEKVEVTESPAQSLDSEPSENVPHEVGDKEETPENVSEHATDAESAEVDESDEVEDEDDSVSYFDSKLY